jgi:hypothetical protein
MSSLPNQPTFLETYKNIETNEKIHINENKIQERYKKEIKFIEEEIQYWKKEDELCPDEAIKIKIQKLNMELLKVKKIYENILHNY